jgi:hypothetical protein
MNDKLVDKKIELHKKQYDKLQEIEKDLITMISELGDEALHEKFIDWMNQRTRCNETYIAIQESILKT